MRKDQPKKEEKLKADLRDRLYKLLEKKVRQYRHKKYCSAKVEKKNFEALLVEVDTSLGDMLRQIPEPRKFLAKMEKETNKWLNTLDEINLASFKTGVCFGVFTILNMMTEKETQPEYLV